MGELDVLAQEYDRLQEQFKVILKEQSKIMMRIRDVCVHKEVEDAYEVGGFPSKVKACKLCKAFV